MTERQYVVFKLGSEEYGIDILNVREITEYKEATRVPNTPDFVDGVINLRGNIVPVINLKKRFSLHQREEKNRRVIITSVGEKQVGFIVDDASQVITLNEKDIEGPHEIIAGTGREYIVGIGKLNEKIIILLDLKAILSEEEKRKIKKMEG